MIGPPAPNSPDLFEVPIPSLPPERFAGTADPDQYGAFIRSAEQVRSRFHGRVIWEVNSTPQGGGVAEMLRPLLGYMRGAGIDARWIVIRGDPAFFRVTKRIHNHLHGLPGDGGELLAAEHEAYVATLRRDAERLRELIHHEDIVILHDPQTAGLVPAVHATGARVVWRSHIGLDTPNALARRAWAFLAPFLAEADAFIFSRRAHFWDILDPARVWIIPPCIDTFTPKNQKLSATEVGAILAAAGILGQHRGRPPHFVRSDGSAGRVHHRARITGGAIPETARLVAQVSRWDHLKDPVGVITGFVDHVAPARDDVHLALVGPEVAAVSDDPEGAAVLAEVAELWRRLPPAARSRVHLVSVPMADVDVNAITVNAIQRHAAVVVQKSLAEGFGLTVVEAMWKSRPVVGARVGGIQDQIEPGVSGLLVDPCDLGAFGAAVSLLLDDASMVERLGESAHERVRRHFLGVRHLLQYFELLESL